MTSERLIIETMFKIADKEGKDVDFRLTKVQSDLDDNSTGRDLVVKARQQTVSSYFLARNLARCLSFRNRRCVIVAHETKATQKLLDRTHYILNHLPVPADLKVNNRNELYFRKTDSSITLGTAGNEDVGVSDTITDLHCTEVPRWKATTDLLGGLLNAVPPSGNVVIESTGHGIGNWFHRECMRANSGASKYKLHFFPWFLTPEYVLPVPDADMFLHSLDDKLDEPQVWQTGLLSVEQMAWRRDKIAELDYDLSTFKENFPLTLDECFQGGGASFFKKIAYKPSGRWHASPVWDNFWIFGDHPKPNHTYAAGIDTGGGVGKDASVLEIFSLEEDCQIGEWISSKHEPHIFVEKIKPILEAFDFPYVNAERNNHGILTLKELMSWYPMNRMHMSRPPRKEVETYGKIADYGTYTSMANRTAVIGSLRRAVMEEIEIHSPILKGEMDSFIEKDNGKVEAEEGCFDDTVMAAAMATFVFPRVFARKFARDRDEREVDPFSLDGILQELEQKHMARHE